MKESEGEYRAKRKDFLSSHALGDFRKCPEFFRKKETGEIEDEDSPAYALGRAAHCLILEGGEVFHQQYFVGEPVNEKTGKAYGETLAYQEWLLHQSRKSSPSDFDFIWRLQVAVWLHNDAQQLPEWIAGRCLRKLLRYALPDQDGFFHSRSWHHRPQYGDDLTCSG
jgi:hypothetical protein